jgi:hypothetical protein
MICRRRLVFICCAFFCASNIFAISGEYQQTKDGKTMIWNGNPRAGETVTWEGGRDKEGYASGVGTLTWYTARGAVYAVYYGNMVHGKLDGPVNAHSRGKTAHALFSDGGRVTTWARGPAPSKMAAPEATGGETVKRALPVVERQPETKPEKTTTTAREEKTEPKQTPAPVITKKAPTPAPEITISPPENVEQTESQTAESLAVPTMTRAPKQSLAIPTATEATSIEPPAITEPATKESPADVSLNALTGPPPSLHLSGGAESATPTAKKISTPLPPSDAALTEAEAIDLADAQVRAEGLDLEIYNRPKIDYSAATNRWTLFYGLKDASSADEDAKSLSVTVEDKTRKVDVRK